MGADTFVGVAVALMAIAMAIIIGYQAISAHEIKNEMKELQRENATLRNEFENHKKALKAQQENFEKQLTSDNSQIKEKLFKLEEHTDSILASTQESVAILNALILEFSSNNSEIVAYDAFVKMHEALYFGLEYDSKNIEFIFNKLRQYGGKLSSLTFGGSFNYSKGLAYSCDLEFAGKSLRAILDEQILSTLKQTEEQIRSHKMFPSISHDYKVLMDKFYKRLDLITKRNFPKDIAERDEMSNF